MSVDKNFEEILAEVLNKDNIYKLNERTELILIFLSANTGTITGGHDYNPAWQNFAKRMQPVYDDDDDIHYSEYDHKQIMDKIAADTNVEFNKKNLIIPLPIIYINIIDEFNKDNSIQNIDNLLKKCPKISDNIKTDFFLTNVKIFHQNNRYYAILSSKHINNYNIISNFIDTYEKNIQELKTIMELFLSYGKNEEQLMERDKRIQDDKCIKLEKHSTVKQDDHIRRINNIIILLKEINNNYDFFTPLLIKLEIKNKNYNTLSILKHIKDYYNNYNIKLDKIDDFVFKNKLSGNIYIYRDIIYGVINIEYNKTTENAILYTEPINIKKIIQVSNNIYKVYDDISSKIT